MNKNNKFDLLSAEDQQFILDLCTKHPYTEVAEILLKPRPDGLQLATSSAALCRWFTKRNAEVVSTQTLGQLSKAIQVRHQSDASGHTEAILTLVQDRLFESLLNGKAVADLGSEFRILFNLHRAYLAEARWQATNNPDADYKKFLRRTCELPGIDFCDPNDTSGDLDFFRDEGEPEEALLEKARGDNLREQLLEQHLRSMASLKTARPSNPSADPQSAAQADENASGIPHKPSVIPHIPPHSTPPPPPAKPPGPITAANPQSKPVPAQSPLNPFIRSIVAAQFAAPLENPTTTFHLKTPAIPRIPRNSTILPRPVTQLAAA